MTNGYEYVVQRAISALANNSPHNRRLVYDKARDYVRVKIGRYDGRIEKRQMELLELAISSVESRFVGHVIPVEAERNPVANSDNRVPYRVINLFVPADIREDFLANLHEIYEDRWMPAFGPSKANLLWWVEYCRFVSCYRVSAFFCRLRNLL